MAESQPPPRHTSSAPTFESEINIQGSHPIMASSSTMKSWKQQATVLTIMVAALIMGLALPAAGSVAQKLGDAASSSSLIIQNLTSHGGACEKSAWSPTMQRQCPGELRAASTDPKAGVPIRCCMRILQDACGCAILKNQAALGFDLAKACRTHVANGAPFPSPYPSLANYCNGVEAAKKRDEEAKKQLSKLDPCERMFQQLFAGEKAKVKQEDVNECAKLIRKCNAGCLSRARA
ncbi:hypothetical protein ACP70R_021113 [Stipagrostis hirtigluma subsp. patula]